MLQATHYIRHIRRKGSRMTVEGKLLVDHVGTEVVRRGYCPDHQVAGRIDPKTKKQAPARPVISSDFQGPMRTTQGVMVWLFRCKHEWNASHLFANLPAEGEAREEGDPT